MASVRTSYSSETTFTITNLLGLGNSAATGWQSAPVDNTSNLYLDAHVMVALDFANVAPANSKAAFVYAYGGNAATVLTNPAATAEGTITLVDVTANAQNLRLIGSVPYTTQDEKAEGGPFSVAAGFGGWLPSYWGVVILNHSGASLSTASGATGNLITWTGLTATIA